MDALVRAVAPHVDPVAYVGPRLGTYDTAELWYGARGLEAFILLQQFEESGQPHVYIGPLFSRGGGCVNLMVAIALDVLEKHPGRSVHFLAEFQNPEAMLMFRCLFPESAAPSLTDAAVPPSVRMTAAAFARRISHIGEIELSNLSTRSGCSLYRARPGFEPVVRWLATRGVDLGRGDSALVIATCDGSARGRAHTHLALAAGARALASWPATSAALLEGFVRATQ
jgi:hypothetical protein